MQQPVMHYFHTQFSMTLRHMYAVLWTILILYTINEGDSEFSKRKWLEKGIYINDLQE